MKIVFFGTPYYVLPVLTALHKKFVTGPGKSPITAVVTQPPKPVGRKQVLSYSPIDKWAHEHKIPTYYSVEELIKDSPEFEMGVLASYGEIIPKEVINIFSQGLLVIHPSLLPKYRGASPVPAAIAAGDALTGVTIFKMDEKVDHGPIITQFKEEILDNDTSETLRDRLFEKSKDVLVETVEPYLRGKIKPKKQDDSEATFTKTLKRDDGFIDLTQMDPGMEKFVRAMLPWPGAWTNVKLILNGKEKIKRMKILATHVENEKLVLDQVQLEGKEPTSWKQFTEGYKDATFLARG